MDEATPRPEPSEVYLVTVWGLRDFCPGYLECDRVPSLDRAERRAELALVCGFAAAVDPVTNEASA